VNIPVLELGRQYESIREELDAKILEVVRSGKYILGPYVKEFEAAAAEYCGCKHAIGVASGTDALLLSLKALGIGPGDGVILPSFTFFATAGVVHNIGATPVFCDIDPNTFNLDPAHLRSILQDAARGQWPVASGNYESGDSGARVPSTGHAPQATSSSGHMPQATGSTGYKQQATGSSLRFKAVIPVHLYGQMADMDKIMAVADEFGLAVVEDAAQAIGAKYWGMEQPVAGGQWCVEDSQADSREGGNSPQATRHKPRAASEPQATSHSPRAASEPQTTSHKPPARKAGTLGDLGCFSFYPTKNLGAYGDGGLVTTNDDELAGQIGLLRVHGARPKYFHKMVGFNSRLDAIQAAILQVKLGRLDAWSQARRDVADRYDESLADLPGIVIPFRAKDRTHIFHQYTIRVLDGKRDALAGHLKKRGIGTMIYYPVPLHLQECFAGLGYREGYLPESERMSREVLSLPIFPELTEEEQTYVADAIREFVS